MDGKDMYLSEFAVRNGVGALGFAGKSTDTQPNEVKWTESSRLQRLSREAWRRGSGLGEFVVDITCFKY